MNVSSVVKVLSSSWFLPYRNGDESTGQIEIVNQFLCKQRKRTRNTERSSIVLLGHQRFKSGRGFFVFLVSSVPNVNSSNRTRNWNTVRRIRSGSVEHTKWRRITGIKFAGNALLRQPNASTVQLLREKISLVRVDRFYSPFYDR